jgi:hypothetical protein
LAGIYPFGLWEGDEDPVVFQSLMHWTKLGGGQWCAWSGMWAVCLLARGGWHDAAEHWLRFLVQATRNEGGSLSAAGARGVHQGWGSAEQARRHFRDGDHEVMQLDANLGVISAALEVIRAKQKAGVPGWAEAAPPSLAARAGLSGGAESALEAAATSRQTS